MADIDLKTETPDTTLPTTGFLFGADSQAASAPSVYSTQTVATTLLGSTSLTGATITASAPVLDLAQTWNASGVTFTGLKFNAAGSSDANSAAASMLMDLQVGGSSRFQVFKNGGGVSIATSGAGTGQFGVRVSGDATSRAVIGLDTADNGVVGFGSGLGPRDTFFGRRAAANLRLGAADAAAPFAQTLSVQSVVAGTTNTAGANLTITGSQGTGTGAGGSIIFQVAPAGSSGTAQNALATALTINSAGVIDLGFANPSIRSTSGGTNPTLGFGSNLVGFTASGFGGGTPVCGFFVGATYGGPTGFAVRGDFVFGWTSTTTFPGTGMDTILARDAANTLALRNGTNAQTFNVYNTYTSSTNFERFRIVAQSAAAVLIGTEKGSGGGTARALALQTDGTTRLTIETNGDLTIADAENIILGTTTGTKIGTATTQKIGFFNAAPVVQPTAVADATDNATAITQLNALLSRMRDLGLIAT